MNKDEALKMAIEYFEAKGFSIVREPILQACKEALEQPTQEHCVNLKMDKCEHKNICEHCTHPTPSWQGLSDDERQEILEKIYEADGDTTYIDPEIAMIEAEQALKEKNHE